MSICSKDRLVEPDWTCEVQESDSVESDTRGKSRRKFMLELFDLNGMSAVARYRSPRMFRGLISDHLHASRKNVSRITHVPPVATGLQLT